MTSEIFVEVRRGDILESVHRGIAAICTPAGEVVRSWGDASRTILPRSACKMLQALPLVESGAADAAGLNDEHLALACASHNGAKIHVSRVRRWLADLGMSEADLRCGPQMPISRRIVSCTAVSRPCAGASVSRPESLQLTFW